MVNFVHRRLKDLKLDAGFTIVELMIALTLLGGVLGVIYSLHSYGMVSFSRGEAQMVNQQEVRFLTKLLSEEIRYAETVKIYGSLYEAGSGGVCYTVKNGNVIQIKGDQEKPIADSGSEYSLQFESEEISGNLVVELTVSSGQGKKYEIRTKVLALNATLEEESQKTGSVLCVQGF
ncbi:MAG: prepilin-type N-terminal cleavage/methylation domain-containing protein [Firmicutes bacterium]|nr:prepilin-type N-terminal cleavage/methylation domain-containing protein [Bacillota bacterium]